MSEQQRRFRDIPVDRSEGFGERLLGVLLDRAHEMPPQLVAPLIAEEVAKVGGRDLSVLLQDYEQLMLMPLRGRGLLAEAPHPIGDSPAGTAFLEARIIEVPPDGATRLFLPLLDGSDQSVMCPGLYGVELLSATDPTDTEAPTSARRSASRMDTYWADSTGRRNTLITEVSDGAVRQGGRRPDLGRKVSAPSGARHHAAAADAAGPRRWAQAIQAMACRAVACRAHAPRRVRRPCGGE